MRIQTNVESLNAYRNLSETNRQQSTHMERLSSGFRINRAADDAAGLAISEQMRGQVGGLDQATENAQDATSLIQTAEGALNESHEILQRMRELSVQSANDTLTESDRAEIAEEVGELQEELDRIAETTEFNTQELLDGEFEEQIFHIGANEDQNIEMSIENMDSGMLGVGEEIVDDSHDEVSHDVGGANALEESEDGDEVSHEFTLNRVAEEDVNFDDDFDDELADADITHVVENEYGEIVGYSNYDNGEEITLFDDEVDAIEIDDDGNVEDAGAHTDVEEEIDINVGEVGNFTGEILDNEAEGEMEVEFRSGIDVSERDGADEAITTLDSAIEAVSSERSELGAVQNRLDHTVSNLEVASENLQAAESRIRDTDMAAEMTEFTTTQILEEAGTAMLAQANQAPQNVLQLLG